MGVMKSPRFSFWFLENLTTVKCGIICRLHFLTTQHFTKVAYGKVRGGGLCKFIN
jgi:hypothetical protein